MCAGDGAEQGFEGEGGTVGLDQIGVEHGAVEGDQIGFDEKGAVQGGNVAETDENLRLGTDDCVIEQRKQTGGAVSAAKAKDGAHFSIGEHFHHVAGAVTIRAGKKSPAVADVGREFGFETQLFENGDGKVNGFRVGWSAGGCDNGDGVARIEPRGFYRHA